MPVAGGRQYELYRGGQFVGLQTSEAGDEIIQLRTRVAELEEEARLARLHAAEVDRLTFNAFEVERAQWRARINALAWAIEHDQRPPHEGDEVKP